MSDSTVHESDDSDASVPDERFPVVVAVSMLPAVLVVLVVAVLGRSLWFFSDDWNILAEYHDGNLLEPFNGHLSAVPAGIYQLLFHTVGVGSYVPYRLVGLAALAVLGFQISRLVEQRLAGHRSGEHRSAEDRSGAAVAAAVGFLAVAAVLWNSAGQMNLMFPFLMNFTIPVAALAAIWWHLDRGTVRGEVGASIWLGVALATSGLGVMTAFAVGVELLLGRAPLRRWLVLAPGPALWSLWFLTNRDANELTTDLPAVLSYTARMLLSGFTSIAAGLTAGGVLLALAFVAYLTYAALRWQSLDARLVGALAAPVAFAALTAVTRIGIVPEIPPDELRYSWAVAAYLVLAALLAARPPKVALAGHVVARAALGSGLALAVLVAGSVRLVGDLREWNHRVSTARPGLSALLFATEAVGEARIDLDRVIPLSYVPVTTGGYLAGVDAVGSPIEGVDPTTLIGDDHAHTVADQLLVEELPIVAEPAGPAASCPQGEGPVAAGTVEVEPGATLHLAREVGGPAEVGVARFTASDSAPRIDLPEGPGAVLHIPADAGSSDQELPYRVTLPDGLHATVCR